MTMKTTDSILGPVRGNAADAIAYAKAHGAQRISDVIDYIKTVYSIAPQVGLDPAVVIAQAMHETGDDKGNVFNSYWWVNRLNPAGLGITGDKTQNNASHTWTSGVISAKSHLAHLLMYTKGTISGGGLNNTHDVRYDAYVAAYGNKPIAKTIADLATTWGTDPSYATGVVNRGNACFPNLENTTPGDESMTLYSVAGLPVKINLPVPLIQRIIPVGQTNQRPGIARALPGYWVQHETANTNAGADADMHATYMFNGCPDANGNPTQTSWHFSVDDHHIIQHIPINEVTWQAADGGGPGNMSGVSCEMCVNSDGNESQARHNTEALCAAICKALGLSIDRVKRHYDFNAADPNRHHCPDHMMSSGYWPTFVSNVNKLITGGTTVPTSSVTYPEGMDAGIAANLFGAVGTWKYAEGGALSSAWLNYGKANGVFPRLVNVKQAVDSPTITRTYWQFSNGLTFWRPNDKAAIAILK